MPVVPRLPGGSYPQALEPFSLAGMGWMDNTELGFPTGAAGITVAARVDSNPILVAGLNGFMVISNLTGAYNVSVSHCDPLTNAILVTIALRNAVPGAANEITMFGAFSTGSLTATTGHVFFVVRIGLQGNGADRTLSSIGLWAGTR